MFVKADKKFYSVCDTGFTNLAAKVVCRRLGYRDGLYQCCSALGHVPNANISIINIRCNGGEESLDVCPHEFGTCQSGNYVSVYCSYDVLAPKSGKIQLDISRCGLSANETTIHPSHKLD